RGCQPMNSVFLPAAGAGLVAGPAGFSVPVGASGVPVPAGTADPLSGPGTSLAAKETVPGNSTGLPKSTCQVNASGRSTVTSVSARAAVYIPCAIARGKPKALAGSAPR